MAGSTWTLTGNSSGAQAALTGAGNSFQSLGGKIVAANQALELGKKILGGFQKAWGVVDKLFIQTAKDVAVSADRLAKFSRTVGESTKTMQSWRSAAGMAGIEEGNFDKSVLKANKALLDADRGLATSKELFDKLGISARDADGEIKTGTELLGEMADSFKSGVIPEGQQAAITMQLLGDRTGMMAGFLRQGTGVVDEAAERLRRYGAIMSDELLVVSEEFIDSQQRIRESMSGIKNVIAGAILPEMTALQNTFADTGMEMFTLAKEVVFGSESMSGATQIASEVIITSLEWAFMALVKLKQGYDGARVAADTFMLVGVKAAAAIKREEVGKLGGAYMRSIGEEGETQAKAALEKANRELTMLNHQIEEGSAALDESTVKWIEAGDRIHDVTELFGTMREELKANREELEALQAAAGEGVAGPDAGVTGGDGEAPAGVGDQAEVQAEKVTGAVDSMTEDYSRLGEAIGGNIASIITAEDKTQAAKDAVKQMATEGIKYLGQMAMTAVAGRASIATTNVASAAAETAAATPAAIVGAIASEGANVGLASAAIAGGVALMSGIIAGIGDRGIPAGLLGPGRHTVIMRGDEAITDPSETRAQARVGQRLEQAMGNGGGGGGADLLAGAFGGGGGRKVTVPVVMQFPWGDFMSYFDTDITERTELGIGPFGTGALGVSG